MSSSSSPSHQANGLKKALRLLVVLAGVLVTLVMGLWLLKALTSGTSVATNPTNSGMFNLPSFPLLTQETIILVMGVDHNLPGRRQDKLAAEARFDGARTDTMLLVRLSPRNNTISAVSLPRDSKVYLADTERVGKLNSAFSMGGAPLAKSVVEYSFGVPIEHTMAVHLKGVGELVDSLGGVDVMIDKPMHYRDWTDGLNINFEPGPHHLSGQEALGYLRFRHDRLADIGRIRRQQYFISALKAQLLQPATLLKLPGMVKAVSPYIQTDMDGGQLLAMANFVRQVPAQNVRVATLPGYSSSNESTSYWIVSPLESKQLLNRLMFNLADEEADNREADPLRVGIVYPRGEEALGQAMAQALATRQDMTVSCQRPSNRPVSLLVESSFRIRDEDTAALRKALPAVAQWPVVVAPNNGAYDQVGCDTSSDYTLVIGMDQAGNRGTVGQP
jgi:polyisoprenyl-teichoic acid--peptidoglycan teichoic acid transferase